MPNETPMKQATGLDEDEVAELDYVIQPCPATQVTLLIPDDLLRRQEEIAAQDAIGVASLLKSYISNGYNADAEASRGRHLLDQAAAILARHIDSPQEVEAIVAELRQASSASAAHRRVGG